MEPTNTYRETQNTLQPNDADTLRKLTVYTILFVLGLLAVGVELPIPKTLTLNEWLVHQLNTVEQLLDNPTILIGYP